MSDQAAFGYTVDMDDAPRSLLPKGMSVDDLYDLLNEFTKYYPRATEPGDRASQNGSHA